MTAEKFWFGSRQGKELSEVPSGYLRWMVENLDPKPWPRDIIRKTAEEAKAMEDPMRNFLRAAADELRARKEQGRD